jgi:hypothetical protein
MGNLYLSVALVLFNLFKHTNTNTNANTSHNLEIYNISYLLFLYAVDLDPLHRGDCL